MSKHDSPRLRRGSPSAKLSSPFDKPPAKPGAVVVSLANEQSRHSIDEETLIKAVQVVVRDSPFTSASISLAVVDDATMHQLNRQYLDHDYPTDVLSFLLENDDAHLEGEVIISADTAAASADEYGWPTAAEQLLYVIHGTLHLVGHGDKSSDEIQQMRAAEGKYLRQFGFEPKLATDKTWEGEAPAVPEACADVAQQEFRPPIAMHRGATGQ